MRSGPVPRERRPPPPSLQCATARSSSNVLEDILVNPPVLGRDRAGPELLLDDLSRGRQSSPFFAQEMRDCPGQGDRLFAGNDRDVRPEDAVQLEAAGIVGG